VVLDRTSNSVDTAATVALRSEINDGQLQGTTLPPAKAKINGSAQILMPLSDNLEVVNSGDRHAIRCQCGCDLGNIDQNWKLSAAALPVEADVAGPRRLLHKDLEMVKLLCPECGTLLGTDIKLREEPLLFDQQLQANFTGQGH
jgi:acetone carboxylase gamma subunit